MPDSGLAQATLARDLARERMSATLRELHERLAPGTLMDDAWQTVRDRGVAIADDVVDKAVARPAATTALVAGAAMFLFRKPILRSIRNIFSKASDET